MLNVTFTLEAYKRIHNQRFIFAAILTLLYPVIIFANLLIIYVISMERSLHKPMYILICNLACINFRAAITLSITASLQICGNVIEKIYCDNYSVVKLACSDSTSNNIYSTIVTFYSVLLPFFIIIYSYIRIIFICLQLTRKGRTKLMNTCMPHIVSITSFFIGCAFELFQSRFDLTHVPYTVRVILSLYFLILAPILNPVIYGAKTEKINETIKTKISNRLLQEMSFEDHRRLTAGLLERQPGLIFNLLMEHQQRHGAPTSAEYCLDEGYLRIHRQYREDLTAFGNKKTSNTSKTKAQSASKLVAAWKADPVKDKECH
ncbi:olfactory receptor 10J5-like [Alosa alosa]|uniref:olfactory receptor 10J5-like n=1 Tax=Alosa alosa TaxID=278164 RepID=UPI0020150D98|nr:olfactory receptor 10J5-like [Alosa alosa]